MTPSRDRRTDPQPGDEYIGKTDRVLVISVEDGYLTYKQCAAVTGHYSEHLNVVPVGWWPWMTHRMEVVEK